MENEILFVISMFSLDQTICLVNADGNIVRKECHRNNDIPKAIYEMMKTGHTKKLKIHGNKIYAQRFTKELMKNYTHNVEIKFI